VKLSSYLTYLLTAYQLSSVTVEKKNQFCWLNTRTQTSPPWWSRFPLQWHSFDGRAYPTPRRRGASQCGAKSNVFNPSIGLKKVILSYLSHLSCTCLSTYDEWRRPDEKAQKAQTTDKHHHHGGGAARPSSGVNLMNPCCQSSGRPSAYFFQYRCQSNLIDSIN